MTEIEMFIQDFLDEGAGEVYTVETSSKGKILKTVAYGETRYQVFNSEGKRIFVSTGYIPAIDVYNKMIKEV